MAKSTKSGKKSERPGKKGDPAAPVSKSAPMSEPPPSGPPSSRMIPGAKPSSGPYIAGILLMGGLIAGLVMWQRSKVEPPPPPPKAQPTATASASGKLDAKLPEFAPPAPPPPEEVAPSASTSGKPAPHGVGTGGPVASGACEACGSGVSTGELNSAVRARAGTAQGCYNRALREGGSEGSITVSVSVGNDGTVCSASAVGDTLHNPAITSCVISKFRGSGFPKPKQGCVVVQVPISFKVK